MSLFSMFRPAKDFAFEVAVKLWFNQFYQRYGQMTRIQIDSQSKRVELELDLKGESTPLHVAVKRYQVSSHEGEMFVELGEIETSREWLNCLIDDYLLPDRRRFKVPAALKMVL